MLALLKLIPLKDWLYIGAIITLTAGGFYLHHKIYESGVQAEVAKVQAQDKIDHDKLVAKATAAEHSHDTEIADLQRYRSSHPGQPVRLCLSSGSGVQAAAAQPISGAAVAAPGVIQQVPAGDSGIRPGAGPDVGGLLEALAARADQVTAQARELQGVSQ